MRSASIIVAALTGFALTAAAIAQIGPARRLPVSAPPPAHGHYFIDFRARTTGLLGHTFIYYGRIDARGRLAEAHFAGLYPDEGRLLTPFLPMMLVPGYVSVKMENPDKDLGAIYRLRLSARQYARVKATVRRLRRRDRWWHFAFYNCNEFVGYVARAVGLRTPPGLDVPTGYIRALKKLNAG